MTQADPRLAAGFLTHPVPVTDLPDYLQRCVPLTASETHFADNDAEPDAILETLSLLCPDAPVEIRVLLDGGQMQSRRFVDHATADAFVRQRDADTSVKATYVVMNPFDASLIKSKAVDDGAVTRRCWILIDADAKRPAVDMNSTDAERTQTFAVATQIAEFLTAHGWPEPVECDSGNGAHLAYSVDLPNDASSLALVSGVLKYLAARFDTPAVHVDTAVSNASRVTKLYGTMTRKGPPTLERPHRRSAITHVPAALACVPLAALEQVAGLAPKDSPREHERDQAPAAPATAAVVAGGRNTWLCSEGGRLRRLGYSETEMEAALRARNAERCQPPLDDAEVAAIARSCCRYEPAADIFPTTEIGDAEFFVSCNAHAVRYDHLAKRWLTYRDHHWSEQTTGDVHRLALDAVRARQRAAVGDRDRMRWAIGGESRSRQANILSLAENLHPVADAGEAWDPAPDVLAVANGVIDLRTGLLRDGQPEDRITLVSPLRYDPRAPTARWEQFVLDVCDGSRELADYFQVLFGYGLTGETCEQCFWIFYGPGSNGKSTLLEVLTHHVMPKHSWTMKFPSAKWSESMSDYQKAQLVGRRLITSKENEQTQRLNTEFIKSLTGNETIEARHPYGRPFNFRPVAKFIMAVNHKPTILDETHGMWRRVRMVPFLRTFKLDPMFAKNLIAEAPGALTWAVRGAARYYAEGLRTPQSVLSATTEYQNESDSLTPFFEQRCVLDSEKKIRAQHLFDALRAWYNLRETPTFERLSQKDFGRRIAVDSRFTVTNGEGPERRMVFYHGVGLLDAAGRDDAPF